MEFAWTEMFGLPNFVGPGLNPCGDGTYSENSKKKLVWHGICVFFRLRFAPWCVYTRGYTLTA